MRSRTSLLPISKVGHLIFIMTFASSTQTPYELIFMTDSTTETSGSITLRCRDQYAEDLEISQVIFWLNRTTACDSDLRERADVRVIEVDNYNIKFNLTRNLDGHFSCGKLVTQDNRISVQESDPKTLICKFCGHNRTWCMHGHADVNLSTIHAKIE